MIIIGAGMAGLIAANYFRKSSPVVLERQESLPHNHRALLRFRTTAISGITGIPFRKVFVQKEIVSHGVALGQPTIRVSNMYSYKVTGRIRTRSVWNLKNDYRHIAPADFIPLLATGIECEYGRELTMEDIQNIGEPIISTIPMPSLMKIVGWNDVPDFSYRPIWAVNARIRDPQIDVYQTIYYPELDVPVYRASIIGTELIAEFVEEPGDIMYWVHVICEHFGLPDSLLSFSEEPTCTLQEYGKIVPIDEDLRQEFIYSMTRDYGIYSLGRYATWRQILLDDLHDDLKAIDGLISAERKRKQYQNSLRTGTGHAKSP